MLLGAEGAVATTAVRADDAVVEPTLFDAVTATRNVESTSADVRVYVCEAAGTMSTQFWPAVSQRRHWYA